ncbi:MAG: DUF87 domain-containing protein [Candidatus Gracilibacteria bacterium]|nr:DUF87 domain-containing protein [Candidatus Gracilibacteria bacterium]
MQILEKFQIKCQNSILKISGSGVNLLMNQPEAQNNHDSHAAPHGEAAHSAHGDSHGGHGHHHPAAAFVPENLGTYIVEGPHHSPFDVETFEKCLNELFRQAGKKNTFLSLEIATIHQKTGFYFTCVKEFAEKFQAVIYAFFPAAEISPAEHFPPHLGEDTEFAGGEIVTSHSHYFPIKNYRDFAGNSLLPVVSAFSLLSLEDFGMLQLVIFPIDVDIWEQRRYSLRAKSAIMSNVKRHVYGKAFNKNLWDRAMARIQRNRGYVHMMVYFESSVPGKAERALEMFATNIKACRVQFLNDLTVKRIQDRETLQKLLFQRAVGKKMVLATDEISMFYHFPPAGISLANLSCIHSRKAEAPHHLSTGAEMDTEPFAHTNFRQRHIDFGFSIDDRRRHTYVIGKSGSGKSKLLELMIASDMKHSNGLAVIDPHGDLAEEVLKFVPKERVKDVLYFNIQDDDFPIAFNPLAGITPENKHIIIHGFISIFQKLFSSLWLPGMEHVLRYALLAVLDLPEPTINDVQKMLTDKSFRQDMISVIKEPSIRNFWANEFLQLQEKQGHKTVTPLINKLGEFTLNPLIQRIVGQKKCNINFDEILNEGKILIINLAKGKIGENNCALLGSMLITKIQEVAMARIKTPEEERRDFYLYIDEFQNFASNAFIVILSEARKFRLNLIIAHQYLSQLTPEVHDAAFGNVGSIIAFRAGPDDAIAMATEFTPTFTPEDVVNLSIRDIYLKLSVGGKTSTPFSARTLTVKVPKENYLADIIANSREEYATSRREVEAELFGDKDTSLFDFNPPIPLRAIF